MAEEEDQSLAIIGAGTFGLSTAHAWRKKHPAARIHLIDVKTLHTNPGQIVPASEDICKIIRAAYADDAYARLAGEAVGIWRTEEPYAEFFHACGWVVANALGGEICITEGKVIDRKRFEEVYPGSNLDDEYVISEDAESGWAEASRCLEAVLQMAVKQGIVYRVGEAVGLSWQGSRCTGVKLRDGEEISAGNVVLATGPWTLDFLHQCGITASFPCKVAGVTPLGIKLDEEEYERYKDMPTLAVPGVGDITPPDRNRIIKINNAVSFYAPDISSREISTGNSPYFEENIALLRKFFPTLHDAPIAFRRYCFDLVTPTQDFIISALPERESLYIAAGGSFHGWKFLPNIGGYVVQMIEGTLPLPWSERWRIGGTPSPAPIYGEAIPDRPFI